MNRVTTLVLHTNVEFVRVQPHNVETMYVRLVKTTTIVHRIVTQPETLQEAETMKDQNSLLHKEVDVLYPTHLQHVVK